MGCTFSVAISPWATQLNVLCLILLKTQRWNCVAAESQQVFWKHLLLLPRGWSTTQKCSYIHHLNVWLAGWGISISDGRLQAPGEWGTCALESYLCWEGTLPTDLPSNVTWLWDYAESHVARQGKPAYLCRQLATVTWGRTVSPHLGLCYWWQKGCCGILLMWLACFWYPVYYSERSWPLCMA